jgi:hypothetical protein
LRFEQEIFCGDRSHRAGATQPRGYDSCMQQREQHISHAGGSEVPTRYAPRSRKSDLQGHATLPKGEFSAKIYKARLTGIRNLCGGPV